MKMSRDEEIALLKDMDYKEKSDIEDKKCEKCDYYNCPCGCELCEFLGPGQELRLNGFGGTCNHFIKGE